MKKKEFAERGDFTSKVNSIICGSNVDVLKSFPDNCVDLVVSSPP